MCFVYGTPCIYRDREGCEKARELDIRELARVMGCHSQQNLVVNQEVLGVINQQLSLDSEGSIPLSADTLWGLEERAK
jgi:hypothetical protein